MAERNKKHIPQYIPLRSTWNQDQHGYYIILFLFVFEIKLLE